ncbi:MAG: phosphoesterase PA-phosphatase related protein [Planctomycetaceae bacterium]|nr:phosphoesterase PA-phosphatase related protein [Planctomycetaceae bacterium]
MSGLTTTANSILSATGTAQSVRPRIQIDRRYWIAAILSLLAGLALAIDLPVSQWMHTRQGLKGLHQPLQVVEALGDSVGVAIVLITLSLVAVSRRRELLRMFFTVLAGGLLADVVKFFVARLRPRSFPGEGLLHVESVTETFYGWLPFLQSGAVAVGSKYQSFPSAHTATGVAFAVALTRMYPLGGWWFSFLAAMIALQRVETGAHYVSDTCLGAAIGLFAALTFQGGTPWSKWFDRHENPPTEDAETSRIFAE